MSPTAQGTMTIPEFTIQTASQFVAQVANTKRDQLAKGNKSDLLFRGQPCDKPLLPRLGRGR